MAIVNRDLDSSEQKKVLSVGYANDIATGVTLMCVQVPYPAELKAIQLAVTGLSGTPTYAFGVGRFIAGSGYTFMSGGATTMTGRAFGTSGAVAGSLASSGSSLLQLLAGDVLTLVTGGSNAAVKQLQVSFVVQALQDIKSNFGV